MGKYIFEFALPAILLLSIAWWGLRWWYLVYFKNIIEHHREMKKATKQYERELKK